MNIIEQSSRICALETSSSPQYRNGWQQELAAIIQMRQDGRRVVTVEMEEGLDLINI